MYKGFNLKIDDSSPTLSEIIKKYGACSDTFTKKKELARQSIKTYMKNDGIDAKKLQEDWFQSIKADVFISHSHADEALAMAMAAAMEQELGLRCFIDSCVWGNSDELLRDIDNTYCTGASPNSYSYRKRNRSTSHVHMMLQGALVRMIDQTECVIFLNTPRSMVADARMTDESRTASPWIYAEVLATQIVREQDLGREIPIREKVKMEGNIVQASMPAFYHDLNLKHLTSLSPRAFARWLASGRKGTAALDELYVG